MDDDDDLLRVCEVCGAEDLVHQGNQARCPHCGTVVTTQQSTVMLDDTSQLRYLSQVLTPTELLEKEKKKAKKKERLMPWKLSEAFQIILMAQITGMAEALDLPQVYREMTVKVWMRYLKATGEAFLTETERADCLYPDGWGWLYDPEEGQDKFKQVIGSGKKARLHEVNAERLKKEVEMEAMLRELDIDEDEPLLSSSSSSNLSSSEEDVDDDDSFYGKGKKRPRLNLPARRHWRGWMNNTNESHLLEFNLAVCYLPLLYLERDGHAFSLSDLLSAVSSGKVPYQNARLLMPTHIEIRDSSFSNLMYRQQNCPTRERLELVFKALLKLIDAGDLPNLPLFSNITQLSSRLRLPAQIAAWAKAMARLWLDEGGPTPRRKRTLCSDDHRSDVVSADSTAAAFLLLVLVWLHGDSRNERLRRDGLVRRIAQACGRDDIFLLSEWLNVAFHRLRAGRNMGDLCNHDALLELPPIAPVLAQEPMVKQESDDDAMVGNRRIQKHEVVALIRKRHFAESLLKPLWPLVDSARPCQAQERVEEMLDFSKHLVVFPREPEELRAELGRLDGSGASQDLFEEEEDPVEAAIEMLPRKDLLAATMTDLLPPAVPDDERGALVEVVAAAVFDQPKKLWARAVIIQKSILDLPRIRLLAHYTKPVNQILESRKYFSPL